MVRAIKGVLIFCRIEIISGLTDKGQFQYLTGFKRPKEGAYPLYKKSFTKVAIIISENTLTIHGTTL